MLHAGDTEDAQSMAVIITEARLREVAMTELSKYGSHAARPSLTRMYG